MSDVAQNPLNAVAELLSATESEPAAGTAPLEGVTAALIEKEDDIDESPKDVDTLETGAPETDATDEDPETPDEGDVDTLNNLAEELDIDISDMYALGVKFADGDSTTIGKLKDFYEANQDIETQREQLQTRVEELQFETEQVRNAPALSNELLQARAQVLAIQSQYNSVDWATLRTQNAGQYAAMQQDYRMQFEAAKVQETQATTQVSTHQVQARKFQQDRLFEALPELKDDTFRKDALDRVNSFASSYGYTPSDIAQIDDHRLMKMLIEASSIVNATTTAKDKMINDDTKHVASKTSAPRPVVSSRKASLKRLTERAQRTNDRRDQTAAVTELLNI